MKCGRAWVTTRERRNQYLSLARSNALRWNGRHRQMKGGYDEMWKSMGYDAGASQPVSPFARSNAPALER